MGKNIQSTATVISRGFTKGINKDADPSFVQEGMWTHARNAVNNTEEGNLGTLSNEDANFLCITAGATMPLNALKKYIIGAVQLFSDKWVIYTVGHNTKGVSVSSEIGLFEADTCTYRPIVQDKCLNFDKRYLISGSSREKEDCTWQVYWADGNNPDRFLNIGDPQTWPQPPLVWAGQANINYYVDGTSQVLWPGVAWKEKERLVNDCVFVSYIPSLNCDKIRLARLMETPCLKVTLGNQGGTLRNGTYFATIAYSIKGQRVTDYFSASNSQPIWFPNDLQGSLIIDVEADSINFDEFVLVVVQNINQGTVARQIGTYSTKTTRIALDQIKEDLISVPLQFLPLQTPVFEKSDQITDVNNYLLRVGPTSKFDFNYQPLANLIKAKWASVEYPADYYVKGGNKGSYLRDEVYTFFIRWVYDTGDKSASYHIPGRAPVKYPTASSSTFENSDDNGINSLTSDDKIFEVYNTATVNVSGPYINTLTDDGGTVIATGNMGYWQSTEKYPDDRPDIYNASYHCWTGTPVDPITGLPVSDLSYDLCGTPIRHHKFPDNMSDTTSNAVTNHFKPNAPYNPNPLKIRLMGVYFENIIYPKDNEGNDISGIVGYEILRGSREGNKSIIAKGMLNNFRSYELRGQVINQTSPTIGLYANYPFNTINGFYNTGTGQDHNRPFMDPYIRVNDPSITDPSYSDNIENQFVPKNIVSFHSPDTMFNTPFLSVTELKLYGYLRGKSVQQYIEPNKHPQFKLLSDLALVPAFLAGVLEAIIALRGRITINAPEYPIASYTSIPTAPPAPGYGSQLAGMFTANVLYNTPVIGYNDAINNYFNGSGAFLTDTFTSIVGAGTPALNLINTQHDTQMALSVVPTGAAGFASISYNNTMPDFAYLGPLGVLQAANQLLYYFSEGADVALGVIKAVIPYEQYALQMIAHGLYDDMRSNNPANGLYRFKIDDSTYIRGNIQQLPSYAQYGNTGIPGTGGLRSYSINNLNRSDTVVLRTIGGPNYIPPPLTRAVGPDFITESTGVDTPYVDQSLTTLGHIVQNGLIRSDDLSNYSPFGTEAPTFNQTDIPFSAPIASHYAGIKVRIRNQYGQLQSVKQIIITPCEQKFKYEDLGDSTNGDTKCNACNVDKKLKEILRTPIFFGGDTFVNRYTEKNTMFYFYDWLFGQPDGFEFNYLTHQMIPQPRFFVNSKNFDISELAPNNWLNPTPGTGILPTRFYRLDYDNYDYQFEPNQVNYPGLFRAKDSRFYLACSSVRDFFVESDVLVDFRVAGDYEWEKHYNPYNYTDLFRMFDIDPQNITRGNWYRYDYSLSISKLFNQYFSSGALQSQYYDPKIAKLCYTYLPDRIYYSLQQQDESFKDSWFIFLPNNYREFKSQISGVKSINKSGIFITFKNDSPQMFQGVDTLNTDLGTKITIGDGGLFSQPGQAVTNADKPYEYGSSQSRLAVISTPAGLFFVSQNQGKIFSYSGGLKEISQVGLKWWFALFLKYKLTQHFPNYEWQDNPVAGIGIQAVYDNENSILYFCKKDYDLRPELEGRVDYIPLVKECYIDSNGLTAEKGTGDYFTLDGKGIYMIGDPRLFIPASWTVSYDPKNEFWISFHDWHPDLVIPAKSLFFTTKLNTVWKHNFNCQNYCNYYGVDYPFEIEFPVQTGQTVATVKSIEYILECYKKADNCVDQYHVLDYNFDNAVIYNSEQISGYLNLNIFPKNNVTLSLEYPKFNQNIPMIFTNPVNNQAQLTNIPGFDILFSKEENKYRFNQFWDITKDRGEFPIGAGYPPSGTLIPGTTELLGTYTEQNMWVTNPDGYTRQLNFNNLDFAKPLLQRKRFRHYLNFIALRKEVSGNVNMIIKNVDSKNQLSPR
jgi:hypothetical protein